MAQRELARDHAHQSRLPGPVGAEHPDGLAGTDLERHAVEDVGAPVAGMRPVDSQDHRFAPPR